MNDAEIARVLEQLAFEISHYENMPIEEAREVMAYVASTGYPPDKWLQGLMIGGWATLYYNAWVFRTFHVDTESQLSDDT